MATAIVKFVKASLATLVLLAIVAASGVIPVSDIIAKRPWADVRAYGAKCDGSTNDTAAFARAMSSGASVLTFPTGTCIGNIVVNRTGITLQGMGASANQPSTYLKTYSATEPVIKINGDLETVSMEKVRVSGFVIDGNSQVPGIKVTATAPKVVAHAILENLYIIHTTTALHLEGLGGGGVGEVFGYSVRNLTVYNAANYGIYEVNTVYGDYEKIHMVHIGSYAIVANGLAHSFRSVEVDGILYDAGQNGSWSDVAIEGIYATTPPQPSAFVVNGYKTHINNLVLTEVPNAKCGYGLQISNDGHFINGVRVWGASYPAFPVLLQSGSAGTLAGLVSNGNGHRLNEYTEAAIMKNWHFLGGDTNPVRQEYYLTLIASSTTSTALDAGPINNRRRAGLYLVQGTRYDPQDNTVGFTDLILISTVTSSQTVTILSSNTINGAATRTYSMSGSDLMMSMGTNTYMVEVVGTSVAGVPN